DAFPTLGDVVGHLRHEASRLRSGLAGWPQAEAATNVFLLACALADGVDDDLAGDGYDLSAITAVVPPLRPLTRIVERALRGARRGAGGGGGGSGGPAGLAVRVGRAPRPFPAGRPDRRRRRDRRGRGRGGRSRRPPRPGPAPARARPPRQGPGGVPQPGPRAA